MIYYVGNEIPNKNIQNIEMSTAIKLLQNYKLLAEDIETKSLDYFEKDPVLLLQLGTRQDQFVFNTAYCDITRLKPILEAKDIVKINVNGMFERNMLRSKGIILRNMFDLSLAYKKYRQGREVRYVETPTGKYFIYSLAGMYYELLKKEMSKDIRLSFLSGKRDMNEEQIIYAAKDVEIFDLYDEIVRKLIKTNLMTSDYEYGNPVELANRGKYNAIVLEMMALEYFSDQNYCGIRINKKKWEKLYRTNIKRREYLEKYLNSYIINTFKEYSMFRVEPVAEVKERLLDIFGNSTEIERSKNKDKRRINWNSSQQVRKIFMTAYGKIPTAKGKETLDIKVLARTPYVVESKFGREYVKFKKLSKLIDSYGIKYFEHINKDTERIHFSINQVLDTGRIAPKKPNLAQIPSDKEWRDCFDADEGYIMIGADYSAQESRVMADKSKDKKFIDFFENGDGDSHSMVASNVFSASLHTKLKVSKFALHFPKSYGNDALSKAKELYPTYVEMEETEDSYILKGFKEDWTDKEKEELSKSNPLRTKGKILNFFISFGGSAYTLSENMSITFKEASDLINGFFTAFSDLRKYFDREQTFVLKKGYVVINDITKARRYFPEWKEYRSHEKKKYAKIKEYESKYGKIKRHEFKDVMDRLNAEDPQFKIEGYRAFKIKESIKKGGMNTGIQGTAADMTKTGCILFNQYLEDETPYTLEEVKRVNTVHDELLAEALKELGEEVANIMQKSMETAASVFCKLKVPANPYIYGSWKK